MLPNWLYGKSKSKLASILGGGGGTPADYNQVKAQVTQNAEDIELLSDNKAALTQITNPNLLDNPWFTVNQRNIASWNNESGGYSVDRWKHDANATGNITNGVYTCDAPTYQIWEDDRITPLLGKTLTISWMLSDGSIGFETETLPSALTSDYVFPFTNNYVTLGLKSENSSQVARITAGVAIRAVKLELGSVSTLAMDTAPNYATELLKCQRYFQRIGLAEYVNIGSGIVKTSTVAACVINIQPLRKDLKKKEGGVSLHGTVYIWNGTHFDGAGDQSTSLSGFAIGKDGYGTIDFNSTELTVSSPAVFQFRDTTSYIDLSADL